MLRKVPGESASPSNVIWRRFLKPIIVGELVLATVCFAGWSRLNGSREFRLRAYNDFPWALDIYYSIGELADKNYNLREIDLQYWRIKKQIKDP